jgi:FMN-dependent NADH-azoreductase
LIAELQQADLLVLGVPMYNFGVPSQLKSWFDRVARAGVTFRYTQQGAEGLLKGKVARVFISSGGRHVGDISDGVTPWLKTMLGFIGITKVEMIYAEGVNLGAVARQQAMASAQKRLLALAAGVDMVEVSNVAA